MDPRAWQDIETPSVDRILDAQGLTAHTREWIWILLGRVLSHPNRGDVWDAILAFQGVAGTGKTLMTSHLLSMVCGGVHYLVDPDAAVPQGTVVCCAPDLPRTFSGRRLTDIARSIPVVVATNTEMPPMDNAFVVRFDRPVQAMDPELGAAMAAELPQIVRKMAGAYEEAVSKGLSPKDATGKFSGA